MEVADTFAILGAIFSFSNNYYNAQENYEMCIQMKEDSCSEETHFANALHHLGDLYQAHGQRDKACDAYSRSIEIFLMADPEHKIVNEMQRYLAIRPGPVQ